MPLHLVESPSNFSGKASRGLTGGVCMAGGLAGAGGGLVSGLGLSYAHTLQSCNKLLGERRESLQLMLMQSELRGLSCEFSHQLHQCCWIAVWCGPGMRNDGKLSPNVS